MGTCVAVGTVAEEVDTIINEEAEEMVAEEVVILIKEEVDSVEEVADLVHADADLLILSTIINKIIRIKINISHHRISKHRHRIMDSNNSRNLKHFLYNETIEVKIIINDIELYNINFFLMFLSPFALCIDFCFCYLFQIIVVVIEKAYDYFDARFYFKGYN